MDLVHVRNIGKLCANSDCEIDSSVEDEIMKHIDDAETFVSGIEESRGVQADGDDDNFNVDDFDNMTADKDDFADRIGFGDKYFENNKKINHTVNYFGTDNSDPLEEFEDEKADIIYEIDKMIDDLKDAQEDVSKLPVVTEENKLSEVKAAYKKIKRRYDNLRYSNVGGQIIMGACQVLETVFNGRRNLFGYRPSLKGWTNKFVRGEMRSLKRESANLVSEKIESYGFTEFSKIMITLVPGMLVYAASANPTGDGTNAEDAADARMKLTK